MDASKGLGIDMEVAIPVVDLKTSPGRPVCPTHLVQMKAIGTTGGETRYRCPVEGCSHSDRRERGLNAVIPREPQMCPRCQTACVVDVTDKSQYTWQLICPSGCGFSVRLPKFRNPPSSRIRSPRDIMDV
jgi:hypothetical protein